VTVRPCCIRTILHCSLETVQLPTMQASVCRRSAALSAASLAAARDRWCARQSVAASKEPPASPSRRESAGGRRGRAFLAFVLACSHQARVDEGALKRTSPFTHNCMLPFRSRYASQMRENIEMLRSES
jgi:hypothetical protein